VLLRGGPLELADALEQEATAGPPLEADREDRLLETPGDRPGLLDDLDLLGVRPDQVEDLVVGSLRVLEERG
jgi:hypothetical protein